MNDGTISNDERIINDVFTNFIAKQTTIPRGDKNYGKRKLKRAMRKRLTRKDLETFVLDININDVRDVRRQLTNGKAAGGDEIPPEFYKYAGSTEHDANPDDVDKCLLMIFEACLLVKGVPEYWRDRMIKLLFKGGGPINDPRNHRPITLQIDVQIYDERS